MKLFLLISFQWLKLCWTRLDLKQQQIQVSPKPSRVVVLVAIRSHVLPPH